MLFPINIWFLHPPLPPAHPWFQRFIPVRTTVNWQGVKNKHSVAKRCQFYTHIYTHIFSYEIYTCGYVIHIYIDIMSINIYTYVNIIYPIYVLCVSTCANSPQFADIAFTSRLVVTSASSTSAPVDERPNLVYIYRPAHTHVVVHPSAHLCPLPNWY